MLLKLLKPKFSAFWGMKEALKTWFWEMKNEHLGFSMGKNLVKLAPSTGSHQSNDCCQPSPHLPDIPDAAQMIRRASGDQKETNESNSLVFLPISEGKKEHVFRKMQKHLSI